MPNPEGPLTVEVAAALEEEAAIAESPGAEEETSGGQPVNNEENAAAVEKGAITQQKRLPLHVIGELPTKLNPV